MGEPVVQWHLVSQSDKCTDTRFRALPTSDGYIDFVYKDLHILSVWLLPQPRTIRSPRRKEDSTNIMVGRCRTLRSGGHIHHAVFARFNTEGCSHRFNAVDLAVCLSVHGQVNRLAQPLLGTIDQFLLVVLS
jgi:hypothetical protein